MFQGKIASITIVISMLAVMFLVAIPNAEAASTFSLGVDFNYSSKNGRSILPCQEAYVELWAQKEGGTMLRSSGYTDLEGHIGFNGLTPGNYSAKIMASDRAVVTVTNEDSPTMSAYEWSTVWTLTDGTTSWSMTITSEDRAAWAAYDAVRQAAKWLKDETGWSRSAVNINWPSGDWAHSHGDYIDIPVSTIGAAPIWDGLVIMHEYGHCVHYAARGGNFPEIEPLDPHYMDSESSGAFALVEGWAEFFAHAAAGDPDGPAMTSLESTVYADGPFGNGDFGDNDGNIVEGAVANVLWDIYDGNSSLDTPAWNHDGQGDMVNDEFAKFWQIFLNDDPDDMAQTWSLWEQKDAELLEIFNNARFGFDLVPPSNPTEFTSDHEVGIWSNDSSVYVSWSGANDDQGVEGYSILWSQDPNALPDGTLDITQSNIEKGGLIGTWYLLVRSVDTSSNVANGAACYGPFLINEGAKDIPQAPTGPATGEINITFQILLLLVLIVGAVLLTFAVSRLVRRPQKEDVQPMPPPPQPYHYVSYTYYAPMPPQYQPPPPEQATGEVRFCRNCGRSDIGGPYCPYCGYKLR